MSTVVCKKLTKMFGDSYAVNELDLEINDGEFLVLVGPSGCGKTTTLRMLAGLERVTRGEIYLDGQLINRVPPRNRDIAVVFQNYALYPHKSVAGNLSYALKLRKTPKSDIEAKVRQISDMLAIGHLLERMPHELSGGQRQRVALGRAIIREPKLFLMDEPLSNLDAKLRLQTRGEIVRLQHRLGTTTVYVTHDQIEAMTMGDRIVVMHNGVVQQIGSPSDLYVNPANLFVAGFLGSPPMHFFDARVVAEAGEPTVVASFGTIPIAPKTAAMLRDPTAGEREVVCGIRPEDVIVHLSADDAGPFAHRMTIDLVEMVGADSYVSGLLDDRLILARVATERGWRVGQPVWMEFDPARLHIFSKASGSRIAFGI
jgi:multiple sugar transport system ATP-binding protein